MTEKKIDLSKNIFNKTQYSQTIDTSFRELGVTSISEDLQQQPSVEEFFALYNNLFYDIPPNGETNSHEFLVQQSGEYINFESNQEEIEALQAEITQLRKDLLEAQVTIAEVSTGQSLNFNPNDINISDVSASQEIYKIQQNLNLGTNI